MALFRGEAVRSLPGAHPKVETSGQRETPRPRVGTRDAVETIGQSALGDAIVAGVPTRAEVRHPVPEGYDALTQQRKSTTGGNARERGWF